MDQTLQWEFTLFRPDAGEIMAEASRRITSSWTLAQVEDVLRKHLHRFRIIVKRPRIRGRRKYVGVYRGPEGREILFKISK